MTLNIEDSFEDIPSAEEAEVTRRIMGALYGREDLADMAEGRYLGPRHYDHEGKYIERLPSDSSKNIHF